MLINLKDIQNFDGTDLFLQKESLHVFHFPSLNMSRFLNIHLNPAVSCVFTVIYISDQNGALSVHCIHWHLVLVISRVAHHIQRAPPVKRSCRQTLSA